MSDTTTHKDAQTQGKSASGPKKDERLTGLTSAQVAQRVAAGQTNAATDVKTKSVGRILAEHTFTLFNAVNVAMAAMVAITGQYRNMLFMGVVLANLFIGIFQEIRAKRMVDKLAILTQKKVRVLRDGTECELGPQDLVLDDVIILAHGDQVPADSQILSGTVHMDESLLTGESTPVFKGPGDELLSGSFVESGNLVARVARVGAEGYAARINAEAKHVKPVHSEMLDSIRLIIKIGTYALIPLGLGLFIRMYLIGSYSVNQAILSTVAAVVGMIPQGLVLLTSSVLAIATTRLAMRKVLVQQTYCVETLARVDTLCLDKTGTITTGDMEVSHVIPAPGRGVDQVAHAFVEVARATAADANATSLALLRYGDEHDLTVEGAAQRLVPFSSRRKLSGCVSAQGHAYVMGAAQFVLDQAGQDMAGELTGGFDRSERVLVVAEVDGFSEEDLPQGPARLIGVIGISDQIRASAPETLAYFLRQGVDMRVISGDDPRAVSAIAERAGVSHASECVDASTLKTDEEVREAALRYHVFGRVTPDQKRTLVRALRDAGHVVAMTGDGVNDVLALREADCSISVASGSAAARNVSELVLADDDFAHIPEVVDEGRRSINNLQRSASLFLTKTVYTAVLALVCIVAPPYPFIPIQMSLISSSIIGLPSFVLALEPNHDRVKGNFLRHVLARSLPASASIALGLLCCLVIRGAMGLNFQETSTLCTIVVSVVGIALIWRISQPITPPRAVLLLVVIALIGTGCTIFADFYRMATPELLVMLLALGLGATFGLFFLRLYNWSIARFPDEEPQAVSASGEDRAK